LAALVSSSPLPSAVELRGWRAGDRAGSRGEGGGDALSRLVCGLGKRWRDNERRAEYMSSAVFRPRLHTGESFQCADAGRVSRIRGSASEPDALIPAVASIRPSRIKNYNFITATRKK
jgi:hypothetical protein